MVRRSLRKPQEPLSSSWRFQCGSAGARAEVRYVGEPMGKTPVSDGVQMGSGTHRQQPQLLSSKGKLQGSSSTSRSHPAPCCSHGCWKTAVYRFHWLCCAKRDLWIVTYSLEGLWVSLGGGSEQTGLLEGVPPRQGGWNEVLFKVLANPNHSVVPGVCDHIHIFVWILRCGLGSDLELTQSILLLTPAGFATFTDTFQWLQCISGTNHVIKMH